MLGKIKRDRVQVSSPLSPKTYVKIKHATGKFFI